MKIAIHHTKASFSERWIEYCESVGISYKLVDCYSNDIIQQLSDCCILMWHFSQNSPKDFLFSKQLIYSVQSAGIKVFPDYNTAWHFDDKLGQKYLLEAISAPLAPAWVFYDKMEALQWVESCNYPKVFKLRSGAGSQNVKLITTKQLATKMIRRAFGRGFTLYDPMGSLKERWRLYKLGKSNISSLVEGVIRFLIPPPYSRMKGREKGYVYFQEFIPQNDYDIRVIVIGDKAFAIKRMVREKDFRASGSGSILYNRELFDENTIRLSFGLAKQLKSQCIAFDYIQSKSNPMVVEISYGFSAKGYDPCPGYWDKDINWHEGKFNPYGWMVEDLIECVNNGGINTD